MATRVALTHKTRYTYDRPVDVLPQLIRLRPAPHNRTPVHSFSLRIEPKEHFLNWQQDPYGNFVARVVIPERTGHFEVSVDLVADLEAYNPFDFFLDPEAEEFPFKYPPRLAEELAPFLVKEPLTPRLAWFIERLDKTPRRTVLFLVDTNAAIRNRVDYVIRMEPGVQTPEETLDRGSGSCRDSAHLLVQVLRHLGIAARFVSGYLIQLTSDQKPVDGPAGPDHDFTDLHAWCECFVPGAGWIGLDPTSGLFAAEGHIPLACTPMPSSAAPIEGAVGAAETDFSFEMHVERIVDVPRVTKPFTDEQWAGIVELGHQVDADLRENDVRLTMGGEPTFVSTVAPDADEWNTAALGGDKEAKADRLLQRLRDAWAQGSLVHHGQGKWYPGEQLPRWAVSCYWRKDGVPLWRDEALFAETGRDYGHTAADAERFVRHLASQLGLTRHGAVPAYEDVWYYLWRERRLPGNVDPLDARLTDELERERLARVFRKGLGEVVGWLLPLAHDDGWVSGSWFLRDEHCFLLPGDSPMGYRLPLDSLPWYAEADYDGGHAPDPFAERGALPQEFRFPRPPAERRATPVRRQTPGIWSTAQSARALPATRDTPSSADSFSRPRSFESATGVVRTALVIEPREGSLRVFLPPVYSLEVFAELIAAIEHTARELALPVQVEGYEPPFDPRLRVFKVTPDPGVIEVNVPPVADWPSLLEQTETLYESARQEHLSAEKFDIDGTHIGTGGGHHVVLGGATPADSPFLRRPDVLASLLRFWHNHPSLSYLFSGRFIGPTSQSPRVDEARNDAVYELELAMTELRRAGAAAPYWLVDRIFRNLLVDVTGNTHRTEFCIDKLYSPDSPTGRLGLLELRAFEMPPHHRMASLQHLLVRTLVATVFREPYETHLAHWGTTLHDRFLLPFFIWRDLREILEELERRGYPMSLEWFRPQYEFRFPFIGGFEKDAIHLELRSALEPWHVLGEEGSPAGQTRYVDSSLERMQVRVNGIVEDRHRIVVNGYEVPLYWTGKEGEAVAGVRYRAWQPSSCLHPTIGIHTPLHFDIYDTWSGRAVGGCTYHVVHPGGRAADDRPVNAVAAESRRIARFEAEGHQPGRYVARRGGVHPHFPLTLDLRRAERDGGPAI